MSSINRCEVAGERVLAEKGITSLPVDVIKLATDARIMVCPFPEGQAGNGFAGMLLHRGNEFGIFYSTKISHEGFQRFTIAHELGHYFLEGHPEAVFDANGVHKSRDPFSSNDKYEKQADSFAVGLLMPSNLCKAVTRQYDDGLAAIIALADACNTSLMSSAIRYTDLTSGKIAIIVSANGQVLFSSVSNALRENGFFVERGMRLPRGSLSLQCSNDSHFILAANNDEDDSDLSYWSNYKTCLCSEQVKGLGMTRKILTILVPHVQDEEDEEEYDDEPRFK